MVQVSTTLLSLFAVIYSSSLTVNGFVPSRGSISDFSAQRNHVVEHVPFMVATGLEGATVRERADTENKMPTVTPPINSDEPPTLAQVKKLLPAEAFKVDTATSLFYFAVDFAAVAATMGFLNQVVTSNIYHGLPIWGQALCVAPLQILTGFAMWCMWCIGT
jgi:hypothetical protein